MLTSRPPEASKLICYSSDQIPYVWDEVAPQIQRALDRGSNYTLDEIYEGLCTSKMQLWEWKDTAMVTAIHEEEGVKFCLYLALGGSKMNEWCNLMYIVEDWAKSLDCAEMRIYGRHGWARQLGFTVEYTKMSRKL